ncbi:DUF2630 family protein [soil metagenome]
MQERIQELVDEEHRLFEEGPMSDEERRRLADVEIELDQCWDLLRRSRALRETGQDPEQARVRPPEVVETTSSKTPRYRPAFR